MFKREIFIIKTFFKELFRIRNPIYDESSDCYFAMQFWLKKIEEEQKELREIQHKVKQEYKKNESEER